MTYEDARDEFRQRTLSAMDSAMRNIIIEAFGSMDPAKFGTAGSRDADLPELFKAIDAQFERNLAHFNVRLWTAEECAEMRYQSQ